MFEIISLTQCFQFISDCSLFPPCEEISVWVETVVLGCRRRLTAAVSVSEHSQPLTTAPIRPSPLCPRPLFINMELGVVWDEEWVHGEVRSPSSCSPNTELTLRSCVGNLLNPFSNCFYSKSNPHSLHFSYSLISFHSFISLTQQSSCLLCPFHTEKA